MANFADFHSYFYADFAYFYADFCIRIPPHYNANANFYTYLPIYITYTAEFHIIPYKLVACGIILKFAHTCLKTTYIYILTQQERDRASLGTPNQRERPDLHGATPEFATVSCECD